MRTLSVQGEATAPYDVRTTASNLDRVRQADPRTERKRGDREEAEQALLAEVAWQVDKYKTLEEFCGLVWVQDIFVPRLNRLEASKHVQIIAAHFDITAAALVERFRVIDAAARLEGIVLG